MLYNQERDDARISESPFNAKPVVRFAGCPVEASPVAEQPGSYPSAPVSQVDWVVTLL